MEQLTNEIQQSANNLDSTTTEHVAIVEKQSYAKKVNYRIAPIILISLLIFFTTVFFVFKYRPSEVVTQSPSPSPQLSVESKTSQLAIVESKVEWLNSPQEVSMTTLEVKPLVSLFDLKSDDSLRIFKVGSFSNGKYQSMSLYSMYYGQGMMSSLSGASGSPVVRFAYNKQKNNFVIFANSSCDLLSPFDDWQPNYMREVKEYLHLEDIDQSKLPNNVLIEWNGIEGIPDRSVCGKSTEISINDQPLLIQGPYAPELEIIHNNQNIIGESTSFPGVKIYKRFVSEKPKLTDYENIYYGIGSDGSFYYARQTINFNSLKYSKYPLARNGDTLANDVNDYGPFRIINERFTKNKPQNDFKIINSNLANLDIDQNSIEPVATDTNGNIFYAIKNGSILANSFYQALGSVLDEADQSISQNEYIQCFPILFAKNRLGDIQVYYSGYAFSEIPEQFSTGRAIYTPNIFQVQK